MKLFLDDERTAPAGPEWITVRNAPDAIHLLRCFFFDEVSLDHDLGPEESGNGYQVICEIERLANEVWHWTRIPKRIIIHTANPSARKKMVQARDNVMTIRERGDDPAIAYAGGANGR